MMNEHLNMRLKSEFYVRFACGILPLCGDCCSMAVPTRGVGTAPIYTDLGCALGTTTERHYPSHECGHWHISGTCTSNLSAIWNPANIGFNFPILLTLRGGLFTRKILFS